jgi:hypothetical protein
VQVQEGGPSDRFRPKVQDGTIITETTDEMRGADMATTVTTGEGQVRVFVAVEHCTSECIGIHASLSGNRFEALEPLLKGVRKQFGGFEKGITAGLAIRHDHGSAYMRPGPGRVPDRIEGIGDRTAKP